MKNQNLRANILSASGMVALSIYCLLALRDPDLSPGAARFPRLLSFGLGGLSLLLIGQTIYQGIKASPRAAKPTPSADPGASLLREAAPLIVVIFSACFVLLIHRIGFELSAFLTMFGAMALMNPKEAVRKIYLAVLTPLAIILLFKIGMGLRMPLLIETLFESLTR